MKETVTIIHAAAVRDSAGTDLRPGAVAVRQGQVIAVASPRDLPAQLAQLPQGPTCEQYWHDHLLLPRLVNAHCHLEFFVGIGNGRGHVDLLAKPY